jgi:hypothetical protein
MPRHTAQMDDAPAPPAGALAEHPMLFDVFKAYIAENTTIESTLAIDQVLADVQAAPNINAAAIAPIVRKLFTFDTAIQWGFVLSLAVPRVLETTAGVLEVAFDLPGYNAEIARIYDIAAENLVWTLCEPDDGSEGSSESESASASEDEE